MLIYAWFSVKKTCNVLEAKSKLLTDEKILLLEHVRKDWHNSCQKHTLVLDELSLSVTSFKTAGDFAM